MEPGLLLRGEISALPMPPWFGLPLDMTVIKRLEHPAKDVEELFLAGLGRHLGPVALVLLFPVDIPQFKERVPVVEGFPQRFEILFRIANYPPGSRGRERATILYL